MKEFGKENYEKFAYINFDANDRMNKLFSGDFDIDRIIQGLKLESGVNIEAENTLIIFDEVQETPKALTALKYFCENANEYHIIAAESLLGVAIHEGTSFPVGKVDFMDLYPLSFNEFLQALGQNELAELIKKNDCDFINIFADKLKDYLKQYLYMDLSKKELVGLLCAMAKVDAQTILDGNSIFVEFKGALTEQFVLSELKANTSLPIFYWTANNGTAEIDFITQIKKNNIPIEVKSNENLQAKSLKSFVQRYNTKINVRTSMSNYRKEDWLINIPLYLIGNIENIL